MTSPGFLSVRCPWDLPGEWSGSRSGLELGTRTGPDLCPRKLAGCRRTGPFTRPGLQVHLPTVWNRSAPRLQPSNVLVKWDAAPGLRPPQKQFPELSRACPTMGPRPQCRATPHGPLEGRACEGEAARRAACTVGSDSRGLRAWHCQGPEGPCAGVKQVSAAARTARRSRVTPAAFPAGLSPPPLLPAGRRCAR